MVPSNELLLIANRNKSSLEILNFPAGESRFIESGIGELRGNFPKQSKGLPRECDKY